MNTAAATDEPGVQDGAAGLWRYVLLFALTLLTLNMIWGGLGTIVYPLHVQRLAFAAIFTGADGSFSACKIGVSATASPAHASGTRPSAPAPSEAWRNLRRFVFMVGPSQEVWLSRLLIPDRVAAVRFFPPRPASD